MLRSGLMGIYMKDLMNLTPELSAPAKNASQDIIPNLLMLFVLSEITLSESTNSLNIDARIKCRRGAYQFDMFLQHWLTQIPQTNQIQVDLISCGNCGYHRTDITINGNVHLLFMYSFDRNAKYLEKYLQMNNDPSSPKFAYFLYNLDSTKEKVNRLKLIIPGCQKGNQDEEYDLTTILETLRTQNTIDNPSTEKLTQNIPLLNAPQDNE